MSSAAATACTRTPRCRLRRTAASLNSALYSWTFFGPARGTRHLPLLGGSVYKSEAGSPASSKRLLGGAAHLLPSLAIVLMVRHPSWVKRDKPFVGFTRRLEVTTPEVLPGEHRPSVRRIWILFYVCLNLPNRGVWARRTRLLREDLLKVCHGRLESDTVTRKRPSDRRIRVPQNGQQQMLRADVGVISQSGFGARQLKHALLAGR